MSEPGIEEIAARWEQTEAAGSDVVLINHVELNALIASWRERGELLREAHEFMGDEFADHELRARIWLEAKPVTLDELAALKDKP